MVFTPRTPSISQSLPLCTGAPGRASTRAPTREPGREPTREPGREPGREPTREPGRASTRASTRAPGRAPTRAPGRAPTGAVPLKPIRLPRGASARVTLKSLRTELVVGCGSMYTDLYTRTAPKSQHPSPKRKEIADSVRGKYPNPKLEVPQSKWPSGPVAQWSGESVKWVWSVDLIPGSPSLGASLCPLWQEEIAVSREPSAVSRQHGKPVVES